MSDQPQCKPKWDVARTQAWVLAGTLSTLLTPIFGLAAPPEPAGPPPFEEVCFGDFDDRQGYPTPAELRQTLGRVSGRPGEISETSKRLRMGDRRISYLSGVFRLKPRWKEQTTLRLSLIDPGLFQLHFWRGRQGVTLRYCPPAVNTWGAYRTTRRGSDPRPSTFADWALDCGRYRRAGLGTFEVRYHHGNLVLTRGDLRLLSVPLEGLPTEVYLEGKALVRGILIYRSTGGPRPPPPSPVVLRVPKPAEQIWQTELPEGATFEKLPDGAVELSAGVSAAAGQAGLPIPGPGLYEYIFELEEPDVGTGVFLGSRDGVQLARFAFYRDTTTGRTTFAYLGPHLEATELEFNFDRAMVPYAGKHQWVRLTLGGGVMKCWTTGDGVHWSQSIWSPLAVQGAVQQVGLYCIRTRQKRSIRLRSLEVRRLEALSSLAPEAIQQRVGPFAHAATLEEWDSWVAESRPPDVPPGVWRRACLLRTLAQNPYFSLGGKLIHRLLDEVLSKTDDLPSQLSLLDEAAVLIHGLDPEGSRPFDRHYEQLGLRLLRAGHPDPLGLVSAAVLRTPIWNHDRQNPWPDGLLAHMLLAQAAEDRVTEVEKLLDRLEYWTQPDRLESGRPPWGGEVQHLVDWAEFQLGRRREEARAGRPAAVPPSWRDPLLERLSKEGYNVLAEFQAAIDAGAHRAACQIIATSADPGVAGLLPDAKDHRLLVSLPTAVELAMQRVPALRRAMQEHYGPLGQLRLSKAIADDDPAAATATTLQFCGTTAAAEAHAWLGDCELSSGRSALAVGHYQRALQGVAAEQHAGLHARLRLAGAMEGRDVGEPVKTTVEIGGTRISAAKFEQMVQQIRAANRRPEMADRAEGGSNAVLDRDLHADRYEAKSWAEVGGEGIQRPSNTPERGLDWAARQIAVALTGRQMIVHNQVELAAFDLPTGRRQWTRPQDLTHGQSRWPAVGMRPVVSKTRVVVRRPTDHAAELACFDVRDGKPIWSSQPSDYVASDPLLIGQDLFALTVVKDEGRKLSLQLAEFDFLSGRLRREVPLAEFDDLWEGDLPCRVTEADGRIVVTAAGCVVCCDLGGQVQWIRRQIWIPPPAGHHAGAGKWLQRRHQPPLVADGRVYATQPGVWNVECLDLQTGRLLWRKAVPELTGLLGRIGERLIVETTEGLLAKHCLSGETLWHHDAENRLEAHLCSERLGVVYVRLEPGDDPAQNPHLVLVRLDPASGRTQATAVFNAPQHKEPLFGPLVTDGRRSWGLLASAQHPAKREILELTPLRKGAVFEK